MQMNEKPKMSNDQRNLTTDNASAFASEGIPSFSNANKPNQNTAPSIASNNISIESLSDDDNSSIADSESDVDDISTTIPEFLKNHALCAANGPGFPTNHENGVIVINESKAANGNGTSTKPSIGSIAVQNSSDITFGNKTFYQGPVTIKQFLLEKNQWTPTETGYSNKGFDPTNEDVSRKSDQIFSNGDIPTRNERWREKCIKHRPVLIAILITGIAVIIGAIVFTNLYLSTVDYAENSPGDGDDSRKNIPINSSIENDIKSSGYGASLRLISRSEWLAQPPNSALSDLQLPSKRIIIAHTATENCTNQAMCTFRVRFIQTFHIESRGWDDIGYNFLVGGDGSAYEGRGWDKEGAHTKGYNKQSICIAFIGTFNKLEPPQRQLIAAQRLIDEGIKLKKLIPDYHLYGARQLMPSESPGSALYDIIKTWPHWSQEYVP